MISSAQPTVSSSSQRRLIVALGRSIVQAFPYSLRVCCGQASGGGAGCANFDEAMQAVDESAIFLQSARGNSSMVQQSAISRRRFVQTTAAALAEFDRERCVEVDKLEFYWLLDRQVGRLGAF
jgi:hypothetical protein